MTEAGIKDEKSKILIVEDEGILADGLRDRLEKLGYTVTGIVPSGEEAVRRAGDKKPDLVLMDIKLKGKTDGIEAARQIHKLYEIPVVYLTAYGDKDTLTRAKISEPYGYILKPIRDKRELHTNIEIALYKHKMEAELLKMKKAEAFGKFAKGIAHDFNNLLQIIDGYLQVAEDRCRSAEKISAASMDKPLRKARGNLSTAAELVKKLFNIYKGELLNKKELELAHLIEKAIKKVPPPGGLDVSYDIGTTGSQLKVHGDESRLSEAFANLLLNAVEAMAGKGKGRIAIATEKIIPGRENNFPLPGRQYIKISIRDDGKGIPEKNIEKICDPYFTTKDTVTEKGLGMGLTTSYSIIKSHEGHIEIKSEEGKGTTVHVYLPVFASGGPAGGQTFEKV